MDKLGYYFVGYKVDINENYKDIKALKKEIKALQVCNKIKDIIYDNFIDDINDIKKRINLSN